MSAENILPSKQEIAKNANFTTIEDQPESYNEVWNKPAKKKPGFGMPLDGGHKINLPKICPACNKSFTAYVRAQKYCSKDCAKIFTSARNQNNRAKLNLSSRLNLSGGSVGKINENIVAIDLLKRGFAVYMAYEDTHPFDLLIYKDGIYKRVEVKTGIVLPSGFISVSGSGKLKKQIALNKHDILAVVCNLQDITYTPSFD